MERTSKRDMMTGNEVVGSKVEVCHTIDGIEPRQSKDLVKVTGLHVEFEMAT